MRRLAEMLRGDIIMSKTEVNKIRKIPPNNNTNKTHTQKYPLPWDQISIAVE